MNRTRKYALTAAGLYTFADELRAGKINPADITDVAVGDGGMHIDVTTDALTYDSLVQQVRDLNDRIVVATDRLLDETERTKRVLPTGIVLSARAAAVVHDMHGPVLTHWLGFKVHPGDPAGDAPFGLVVSP